MFFSVAKNAVRYYHIRIKPNRKLQVPFKRWQILLGDTVQVRSGSDKGKVGKVIKIMRRANKIAIKGVNVKTKQKRLQGGGYKIQRKAFPIHVSNAGLYDPIIKKAVRIKYGFDPQTFEKLRVSKKTGTIIPKPNKNKFKRERRGKNRKLGMKDTEAIVAHKVTYEGEDFDQIKRQFEQFIAEKEKRERHMVF